MSLSTIERLPTELLVPIFLLSGPNLDLPLSSHHIARKLSSNFVYDIVCNQFLRADQHSRVERSRDQSRIFAARWMTWNYFKRFLSTAYQDVGCLCGKSKMDRCFNAQWPPELSDATQLGFNRGHLPELSWVKCRIPQKLLHGPWTCDKIYFLRFILWTTSMTVDWADAVIRKLAFEGKREAVLERNLEAVELFNRNRRLGKPPGLSMVRFAVMEAGCDRSIVHDIMATARAWGLRGTGWECAALDAWCEERISSRDPKGEWLKSKLQELCNDGPGQRAARWREEPGIWKLSWQRR